MNIQAYVDIANIYLYAGNEIGMKVALKSLKLVDPTNRNLKKIPKEFKMRRAREDK